MLSRKSLTLILVSISVLASANASAEQAWSVNAPCTDSESWVADGDSEISRAMTRLKHARSGRVPAISLFSEAEAMRKLGLEDARLNDLALHLFASSLAIGKAPFAAYPLWRTLALEGETSVLRAAAMVCLVRLRSEHPSLRVPEDFVSLFSQIGSQLDAESQSLIATFLLRDFPRLKQNLAQPLLEKVSDPVVRQGISLLRQASNGQAISPELATALEPLIALNSLPKSMTSMRDTLALVLAQNHYDAGRYEDALRVFRLVSTRSNFLPEGLTGLAWSALKAASPGSIKGYDRAVGAGLSVKQGGLKSTFIPEPLLVTAIGLQELCLFPEAMQAMEGFRRSYKDTFEWLNTQQSALTNLEAYQQTISFLAGKNTTLPARVGTEWIRHPMFLSLQGDINSLLDEPAALERWNEQARVEQRELAVSLVKRWSDLKQKLRTLRAQANQREVAVQLPAALKKDIETLKEDLVNYRRLKAAAPVFERVANGRVQTRARDIATRRVAIGNALVYRSKQMKRELDQIADTFQLVEIEIFQGASQDIVWREAHPEYAKVEKRMNAEASGEAAAKTWDWGAQKASLTDEGGEIWEDEIGAFQARLSDQCAAKDRYVQLRKVKK